MPDNDIPELVTIESPDLDNLDDLEGPLVLAMNAPVKDDSPVVERRRCFAYNQQAQRCEMDAAHSGLHTVSSSWSDDECLTPGRLPSTGGLSLADMAVPISATLGPAVPAFEPEPSSLSEPCVVCNHLAQKHGGEDGCVGKSPDGDLCSCREFV